LIRPAIPRRAIAQHPQVRPAAAGRTIARDAETASRRARLWLSNTQIDISDTARRVTQPALVLHARHDRAVPYQEWRRLASLLPDARFVTLETNNHILQQAEPAWDVFLAEVRVCWAMTSESPPCPPIY
jgi:pimeloyl-ACP methyl ester carboxylesterase